jgi:hypothetical protein
MPMSCLRLQGRNVVLNILPASFSQPKLSFLYRMRHIELATLVMIGIGNQFNPRDADDRFSVDICIEYDFVGRFQLLNLDLELSAVE